MVGAGGITRYTLDEARRRWGRRYYILYDLLGKDITTLPEDPESIDRIVKDRFKKKMAEEAREVSDMLARAVEAWVDAVIDGLEDVVAFTGDPVSFARRVACKLRSRRNAAARAVEALEAGEAGVEDVSAALDGAPLIDSVLEKIDREFAEWLRTAYSAVVERALERGASPPPLEEFILKNPSVRDRVAYRIAWLVYSIIPSALVVDDPPRQREPLVLWHGLVTNTSQIELADSMLEAMLGEFYDARLKRSVHEKLRDIALRVSRGQLSRGMTGYLPMGDRVLDLDSMEYVRNGFYSPKRVFSLRLDWVLDPDFLDRLRSGGITLNYFETRAPSFMRMLKLLFDEENLPRFMEAIGKIPETRIQSRLIAIIVGERGIGKSTLMDIIRKALGNNVVSNKSLEELASGKWLGELEGKLAVISSEEPEDMLRNIGVLKRITGEPELTGDVKYRRSKEFPNYIKLYFTMNRLPQFKRIDEALLDRMYIIIAQQHNRRSEIPSLYTRIIREELDVVREFIFYCYWMNRRSGVDRKYDMSIEEKYQLLITSESNVYRFIKDKAYVEEDEDSVVERKELYNAYLEWCNEHMEKPVGRNTFYEKIRSLGYREVEGASGKRYFKGLRLTNKSAQTTL